MGGVDWEMIEAKVLVGGQMCWRTGLPHIDSPLLLVARKKGAAVSNIGLLAAHSVCTIEMPFCTQQSIHLLPGLILSSVGLVVCCIASYSFSCQGLACRGTLEQRKAGP